MGDISEGMLTGQTLERTFGAEKDKRRMSSRFLICFTFLGGDSAVLRIRKMDKKSEVQIQKVLV